jgi:glutamate N-acetyltransferase/amino-acid N-acetyltransferase
VKIAREEVSLRNGRIRIAGMTKGAGMIHPNMATTLGFVITDASLPVGYLQQILTRTTENSYNSLSVDGDMSTNDIVVLMANGASDLSPRNMELEEFENALARVMESLARQIAADGEGARKLITISAKGFRTFEDARRVARSIANSPLVKTAIAGSDPNWGRILAAAGYSYVEFDPGAVNISVQGTLVCRRGLAADFDETALKKKLDSREVAVELVLAGKGKGSARFFTCDFTEGYIQINGSYRT